MSDTEAKKHKASSRKLRKKREEGSVPQNRITLNAMATAGGLGLLLALAPVLLQHTVQSILAYDVFLTLPFENAREVGMSIVFGHLQAAVLPFILIVSSVIFLATLLLNGGLVLSFKPVVPDLKRVSPTAGLKRVFGSRGWIESGTILVKIALWSGYLVVILWLGLPALYESPECLKECQWVLSFSIAERLVIGAIALMLIFAALDILQQRHLFQSEQKMTDSEIKQERKDQSGSPEIRKQRNKVRQENMASSAVKLGLNDATIAFRSENGLIAISFDPPEQTLPLIVVKARGHDDADELAATLRGLEVPIAESPDIVANGLRKGRGEMIDVQHFKEFARHYTRIFTMGHDA